MGDVHVSMRCLNGGDVRRSAMPPAYDLILEQDGEIIVRTIRMADAAGAWRFGREHHPGCIRAVVCRESSADQESQHR